MNFKNMYICIIYFTINSLQNNLKRRKRDSKDNL